MALRSLAESSPEPASECVADGLRVLELGSGLAGAIAALILADDGATRSPLRSRASDR